ncbi:carboxymuconolactone decarboxylase family protein [Mariniflexile sp. HMF6888]|jgi:AhpD family alkylhydroperoxidase|uniref:carboxymuconolactone decarboxylase family protein n=1 Tax=Mariniflexile sp. HMF6888 TaxID=3373086 RepID=UPI0037AF9CBA
MITTRKRNQVETEIKETLGLVPSFFKSIPEQYLDYEWQLFKLLELGETLIPNKYKELMGVALHSETKCRYCLLFHAEAAKLFGATEEEVQEAVHYAKMSVGWSVYINGMRTDYDQFEQEFSKIGAHLKTKQLSHAN